MIGIRSSRTAIATLSLFAAVSALILTPAAVRAEQFVLFDVTFTFTKTDADNSTPNKSHSRGLTIIDPVGEFFTPLRKFERSVHRSEQSARCVFSHEALPRSRRSGARR